MQLQALQALCMSQSVALGSMCRLQSIVFQRHMTITDHLRPSYRQADSTIPCLLLCALAHVALQSLPCPHRVVVQRSCDLD